MIWKTKTMRTRQENSLIFILILLLTFGGFFLYGDYERDMEIRLLQEHEDNSILTLTQKLDALEVEAKAISIYDVNLNKKIYGKNDTTILPMASLVKSLSVIVALEDETEDQVRISPNAFKEEGDNGLYVDELWDKNELAKFSLFVSSNDGVIALSENKQDFIDKLNEKAKKIGLEKTFFINASGLDIKDDSGGAYTTAEEANQLALFALRARPDIFEVTKNMNITFKSYSGFEHKVLNTNIIAGNIPNLLFSKTGNTDLAGGNLTIVFKNDHDRTFAVTILGSTQSGRFSDMQKVVTELQGFMI